MANKSGLTNIGLILALIGGILMIVQGVLMIFLDTFAYGNFLGGVVGGIIAILIGVALVFIWQGKVKLEGLVLGIVVLVLGIIGSGLFSLAGIGGILIIVDQFV